MPYIGKTPTVGNFQVCDAISVVNGQAAYTLQVGGVNVAPESANHMLVSLNGILQKPGSSFTISGSTMTFASNLATGDVIDFVQILGNVLDLGTPSDDTVTAAKLNDDIISGQTALAATPADTDELLISDAGTLKRIDYSYIKAVNTPAFSAYKGSAQSSLSANQYNKVTFTTEEFDTDSAYDATNSKFVAPSAGKYFFNTFMRLNPSQAGPTGMSPAFYKNGSLTKFNRQYNEDTQSCEIQLILDLSANDYIEVYLYYHDDTHEILADSNNSVFQGFKLIG